MAQAFQLSMKLELFGALCVPAGCGRSSAGPLQQLPEKHKWQGKLSELTSTAQS